MPSAQFQTAMPNPSADEIIQDLESRGLGWSLDHTGNLIEARIWKWPNVIGRYRPNTVEPLAQMLGIALQQVDLTQFPCSNSTKSSSSQPQPAKPSSSPAPAGNSRRTVPVKLLPKSRNSWEPVVSASVLGDEFTLYIDANVPIFIRGEKTPDGFDPLDDAQITGAETVMLYIDQNETFWNVDAEELKGRKLAKIEIKSLIKHVAAPGEL